MIQFSLAQQNLERALSHLKHAKLFVMRRYSDPHLAGAGSGPACVAGADREDFDDLYGLTGIRVTYGM
ncbi:hypothetical protein [Xanthomonas albilineans]|uniref:hypothetical protein n=1 Tax=Xanthomonas albilineans TaxID=29447 RepID=UPI00126A7502|nr:hypothetical protein [Xanthomonas albilineans]